MSLCYLMMPTQEFKMTQQFKVSVYTCRKVEISKPLVVIDSLKSGARHSHVFSYFQNIIIVSE